MILPKENYVIVEENETLPKILRDYNVGRIVSSNSEIYWLNDIVYFKEISDNIIYEDKIYSVLHEDQIYFVENN